MLNKLSLKFIVGAFVRWGEEEVPNFSRELGRQSIHNMVKAGMLVDERLKPKVVQTLAIVLGLPNMMVSRTAAQSVTKQDKILFF